MIRVECVDLSTYPLRDREPLRAERVEIQPDADGTVWVLVYGAGESVPTAYDAADWRLTVTALKGA
jgi:hypothetical protein